MKFSENAWNKNKYIYDKIINHPFIKELTDGSLDKKIFTYYIEQDSRYLKYFSKALSIIAVKLEDSTEIKTFLDFANEAIVVERDVVHGHFKSIFNFEDTNNITTSSLGYTSELLATAYTKPVEVAMSSVLPCFWVYYEVGKYIYSISKKYNQYKQWIDTYAGDDYKKSVDKMINITDTFANNTTEKIREEMLLSFSHSFVWEYRFWDDSYKLDNFKSL